jgi:prepilin peptidase CpaA
MAIDLGSIDISLGAAIRALGLSVATAWVAIVDLRYYRIANSSVILVGFLGLLWSAVFLSPGGVIQGVFGAVVGFAILLPIYALGGMTAGDVKWMSALGVWYGPKGIVGLFLVSSILLGGLALGWIANRYWVRTTLVARQATRSLDEIYGSELRSAALIPYAVPVAAATILVECLLLIRSL